MNGRERKIGCSKWGEKKEQQEFVFTETNKQTKKKFCVMGVVTHLTMKKMALKIGK